MLRRSLRMLARSKSRGSREPDDARAPGAPAEVAAEPEPSQPVESTESTESTETTVEEDRPVEAVLGWTAGHFYSPIPSFAELTARETALFGPPPRELPGIDLNEAGQLELFRAMVAHYPTVPFGVEPRPGLRFHFDNPNFGTGEAVVLHCLMQVARPTRIVEVGSGYSSCAMLDVDERFFDSSIDFAFVEPYPELLLSLVKSDDRERIRVYDKPVQDIGFEPFEALRENDILFIDSSHVSKAGSDVNHLYFEVLPRLAAGVYVHIHDIYYPFEYPKDWIYGGRYWNEAYLLRALLQHNPAFEIRFFNSWWGIFQHELLQREMPMLATHQGSSIWLRTAR